MKYTVHWHPLAEQELTKIWLETGDRDEITEAALEIDRILERDPIEASESRADELRILYVPPLGVKFAVNLDRRLVLVASVWRFGKRQRKTGS